MDETRIVRPDLEKDRWGPGPWQTEPDRVEFEHAGLPCLALRNHFGVWCGYAAVPPGHPFHGKDYNDVDDVDVHGGLTYASLCADAICHVPKPGEPENVWWFGFDCGHSFDLMPGMAAFRRTPGFGLLGDEPDLHATYRDLAYVQTEIRRLAEHLAEKATP